MGLTLQYVLYNGGPASLVYGSILAGIGSTAIATSLGEMASMSVWPAYLDSPKLYPTTLTQTAAAIRQLALNIDGPHALRSAGPSSGV